MARLNLLTNDLGSKAVVDHLEEDLNWLEIWIGSLTSKSRVTKDLPEKNSKRENLCFICVVNVLILKELGCHVRYSARRLILFILLHQTCVVEVALTRVRAIHNLGEVLSIFQCVLGLAALWQNRLHTTAERKRS